MCRYRVPLSFVRWAQVRAYGVASAEDALRIGSSLRGSFDPQSQLQLFRAPFKATAMEGAREGRSRPVPQDEGVDAQAQRYRATQVERAKARQAYVSEWIDFLGPSTQQEGGRQM